MTRKANLRSSSRSWSGRRSRRELQEARSRAADQEPGDVRGRGGQRAGHRALDSGPGAGGGEAPAGFILAVAVWLWFTRAVRQLRRGDGRGARQGAGRGAAQDAPRTPPPSVCGASRAVDGDLRGSLVRSSSPEEGRLRARRSRRGHSRRRRDHRGRRLGRRERDHRRERAGDPRGGRRPQRGHRRHARAVGLDRGRRSPPNPGETFLDRIIALVEGARRQKTPNEIALSILLAAFTLIFLFVSRDAAAVLDLQRDRRRSRGSRSPSPCWSRSWSA